jgi:hypothetical protein
VIDCCLISLGLGLGLGRLDDIDVDITPGVKITVLARKEKKVSIFTKKIFI